jgi:glycosyltransferase involved in cell wall biosynthesis
MTREVHVVVPAGIDDLASPSGGNRYDRRVVQGLAATGWDVRERAVPGGWPRPDATARAGLATALAAMPDGAVVLVDGLVACGVPDVVVPAARRLALVVLVHLPLGDETGAPPELAVREREVLTAAAAVIATSPWAARRVAARHGLDPARITVATPGVDLAPLAPGTVDSDLTDSDLAETRLLCVGALTPTKGQDLLVAALAGVRDLPWTATLVGPLRDPGHVDAVRAAIERHGLTGRVELTGPLTGAALGAAYAGTDLLVVPSRAETYGMVVTEALARGIPVLVSDAGGLPETLGRDPEGRVPGMVVPAGRVADLGAALHGWMADPDRRAGLRRSAGRRRGMLHGWEVTSRCVATVLMGTAGLARTGGTPA